MHLEGERPAGVDLSECGSGNVIIEERVLWRYIYIYF